MFKMEKTNLYSMLIYITEKKRFRAVTWTSTPRYKRSTLFIPK